MNKFSLGTTASLLLCAVTGFTAISQVQAETAPVPYRQIGKITPRSAKEIAASDWSVGGEVLDRDCADYSKYKSYLGPLGAKAIRFQAGWAKTEKEPGVYNWQWLDDIIDDALSQNVQPWVELSYGNPIYEGGGGTGLGAGLPVSDTALKAWDAWAKALVNRYKDRVHEWEVWNEPDITKGASPEQYATFFIRTAELIRAEAPGSKILALALCGKHEYGDAFIKAIADAGKLDLIDVLTFHGYPGNPDDMSVYEAMKASAAKYGAKFELRQGETGAPSTKTTGALREFEWTELSQAKWDLRRMLAHHGEGVPFSLFTLSEFVYNEKLHKGLNAKGLLRINLDDKSIIAPKPSYFAAQNVFAIFDRTIVVDKNLKATSNATAPTAIYSFRKQNPEGSIVTAWFKAARPLETNDYQPVDFTFTGAKFEHPVYVDPRTGAVYEIPAKDWSQKNGTVTFRAIPVYDSPILIAEKSAFLFK